MNTLWKARLLGALLTLAAVPSLLYVNEPLGGMLAFALAATGLFTLVIVAEDTLPTRATQALLTGDANAHQTIQHGLNLEGPPVYVHDQGNIGQERLFLPASTNQRPIPILDPDTTIYPGTGDTKIGLALPPPGLALLEQHENEAHPLPPKAPIQETQAFLQGLHATHDTAKQLTLTQHGDALQARFKTTNLEPPCLDDPIDPQCQRTGCLLCQTIGCALARSLERPLTVHEATIEAPWVTLQLAPETHRTDDQTDPQQTRQATHEATP